MSRLTEVLMEALEIAAEQEREKESKDFSTDNSFRQSIQIGLLRGKLLKLEKILRPAIEAARARSGRYSNVKLKADDALLEAGELLGVE